MLFDMLSTERQSRNAYLQTRQTTLRQVHNVGKCLIDAVPSADHRRILWILVLSTDSSEWKDGMPSDALVNGL